MKKLTIVLIISSSIFLFSFKTFGQTQDYPPLGSVERIATGQTKWMLNELKFDSAQFRIVYNVNLKYQLLSDSIHNSKISTEQKMKLYQEISKEKKDELREIFQPDIYVRYLSLLQTVKSKTQKK